MPNPLLGVQAETMGFEQGKQSSPFANFVTGAMQGFSTGVKLQGDLQDMELKPQELEMKKTQIEQQGRQLDLESKRLDITDAQENRLQNEQEFEHDYKTDLLGVQRDNVNSEIDLRKQQAINARTMTALKAQDQSQNNIVDGAIQGLVVSSDPSSLIGILGDTSNPRTQAKFLERLNKDPRIASAVADKLEEVKAGGQLDDKTLEAVNNLQRTIEYSKNVVDLHKSAEAAKTTIGSFLPIPQPGSNIDMTRNKDGSFTAFEKLPDGTSNTLGLFKPQDDKETQAMYSAQAHWNRLVDMQKRVAQQTQTAIKKTAEQKAAAQSTAAQSQPDVPARESRAAVEKTPRQINAETRIRQVGDPNYKPPDRPSFWGPSEKATPTTNMFGMPIER